MTATIASIAIRKITVLIDTDTTDTIWFDTSLTTQCPQWKQWKEFVDDPTRMSLIVAGGYGISYIRENFPGVAFSTLSQRTGETKKYSK